MNYEGEKFLLKLYRELYKEESVKHSGTKSDDKFELVKKYLERLESTEKAFAREKKGAINYLKNRYYDKYVIKEENIPESYYQLKRKIALERGEGYIEYTEQDRKNETQKIIKEQQLSLDKWLNYLMKDNTIYPMWVRYWAFQGMLKLGKYDKKKHNFTVRSIQTTMPFIKLNVDALELTMQAVMKYYESREVDDEELEKLIESGNFGRIYAYNMWKLIKNREENLDNNKGIWKVYKNGDEQKLVTDLEEDDSWCIAWGSTAKEYLEQGNMHIYYTKDKEGNYTMPRVCIREAYKMIIEVRGIHESQNLEAEMNEIVDKKLDEFLDKEEYNKKIIDMKKLTKIYEKNKDGEILSKEELEFLYEKNNRINGFGRIKDPRIEKIKSSRNILEDCALVYDCKLEEIGTELCDLRERKIKVFIGNIEKSFGEIPEDFYIPKIVVGDVRLSVKSGKGLEKLERVTGTASFSDLEDARGLENLKIIQEFAYFHKLKSSIGLSGLERVGYSIECKELEDARGLCSLRSVGNNANFPNLINSFGLENLQNIEGDASFNNLFDARGLKNLFIVKGNAYFPKLVQAEGLENLRTIRGTANFSSLTDARGLCSLQNIGKNAYFDCLYDMKGLENLQDIGGESCFGLDKANKLRK